VIAGAAPAVGCHRCHDGDGTEGAAVPVQCAAARHLDALSAVAMMVMAGAARALCCHLCYDGDGAEGALAWHAATRHLNALSAVAMMVMAPKVPYDFKAMCVAPRHHAAIGYRYDGDEGSQQQQTRNYEAAEPGSSARQVHGCSNIERHFGCCDERPIPIS